MVLNYTLYTYSREYKLSVGEKLLFPLHSSYARRHWRLAEELNETHRWGHRFIAVIEGIQS